MYQILRLFQKRNMHDDSDLWWLSHNHAFPETSLWRLPFQFSDAYLIQEAYIMKRIQPKPARRCPQVKLLQQSHHWHLDSPIPASATTFRLQIILVILHKTAITAFCMLLSDMNLSALAVQRECLCVGSGWSEWMCIMWEAPCFNETCWLNQEIITWHRP